MREIKFRAKRIDNGEWIEGFYAKSEEYDSIIFTNVDEHQGEYFEYEEIDETTLCQYIGIKDKDGKKIYEGDILEWQVRNGSSEYYECIWLEDECAFAFENRGNYESPVDCYDYYNTCEFCMKVIGNIFDNPELLERGAE
jgi:uncharacterized phage protein (TIGR01671 family)